jgi:hypothetical protein
MNGSFRSMNASSRHVRNTGGLLLLVCLLAACTQPRDLVTRFRGADQSVDVLEITADGERRVTSPYVFVPRGWMLSMRQQVVMPAAAGRTMCVYAAMLASFDVFWDGQFIGRSRAMDNFFVIPAASATAGAHTLALRVTFTEKRPNWFQGIVIGDYEQMLRSRIVAQVVPLSAFAVFVVIGMYYLMLSFATRRRAAAVTFALLCFAAALLALAETWRWTVGYTYEFQLTRLAMISALTFCVSLLLPAFFILELSVAKRKSAIAACAAALLIIAATPLQGDDLCLAFFWAAVILSTMAVASAVRTQRRRTIASGVALAVLYATLINGGFGFSDNTFFVAFCFLIICLLVSMAVDLRRERREHATREIELLRKTIEPHFVMNTLTAVMEWMETDPPAGVKFLEAFADELRMFAAMSGNARVPVADEIALCRSHLAVMGCRKGKRFHLRADDVDGTSVVPPAIFHTLVENALTHNRYAADDVQFRLMEETANGRRRYTFDAPISDSGIHHGEGTGLRYVRARLEENYPGRWLVQSGRAANLWRTTIEVPA